MERLLATHRARGDIQYEIFEDFDSMHDSYAWIDARISFTKNINISASESIVDIKYSHLYTKGTANIEKLRAMKAMGYFLAIMPHPTNSEKIKLQPQKKPIHKSIPLLTFGKATCLHSNHKFHNQANNTSGRHCAIG